MHLQIMTTNVYRYWFTLLEISNIVFYSHLSQSASICLNFFIFEYTLIPYIIRMQTECESLMKINLRTSPQFLSQLLLKNKNYLSSSSVYLNKKLSNF